MTLPTETLQTSSSNSTTNYAEIKKTLHLLSQGEEQIQLSDRYRKVTTLVLGNTGVGKSTLAQWMATDGTQLFAVETMKDAGEFIIVDRNDKIGNSTLISKTLFPDLILDPTSNTAFYDCPGFDDTRSTSHDIAATYFVKKVADYAESLKMIFVISYSSVRKGGDRENFMRLMRHSVDLIKDIDKFRNCIAIVVTKVDNDYRKIGKTITPVPDKDIIAKIADFLREVKQSVADKLKSSTLNERDEKLYNSTMTFIDILMTKDGDTYSKIGIFRRPDESGPLRDITNLQTGKQNIERIIRELNFVQKKIDDFGYTVSEKSKNDINDLVEEINKEVWSALVNIADRIKSYYHDLIEPMRNKIQSFAFATHSVQANLDEAKRFYISVIEGKETISRLQNTTSSITVKEYARKIDNNLATINIPTLKDSILNITNQGSYLDFFEIVSNRKFNARPMESAFQNVATYLDHSERNIQNDISDATDEIFRKIDSYIKGIADQVKIYYEDLIESMRKKIKAFASQKRTTQVNFNEAQQLNISIIKGKETISRLKDTTNSTTAKEYAQKLDDNLANINFSTLKDSIRNITNQDRYLEFFEIIRNRKFDARPWGNVFQVVATYLDDSNRNIQIDTNDTIGKIVCNMESNINATAEEIRKGFQNKVKLLEFQEAIVELKNVQNSLHNCAQKMNNQNDIRDLVINLNDIIKLKINTSVIRAKISDITNLEKRISFLKRIGNHEISISLEKFVTPFEETARYLNELGKWYEFLSDLYAKFSVYNIQRDTSVHNVFDIENKGYQNNNFDKFLEKIERYNVTGYDVVKHIKITEYQTQELNNILSSTLTPKTNKHCDVTGELVVTGDYIKFSDIAKTHANLYCEFGEVKSLKIYATNMIIIDQDLQATGKKLQLTIIAPKWIIEGQRKITLDGVPGPELESSKAKNGDKDRFGSKGEDGKPGLPGGPAGNFLGIGRDYVNGTDLTISSIGGNGSAGQNGGDGSPGADGEQARLTFGPFKRHNLYTLFSKIYSELDFKNEIERYGYDIIRESTHTEFLKVNGFKGGSGGNGGNGGKGGKYGYGGNVKIIELGQTSNVLSYTNNGTPGKGGSGGKGGLGGQDGPKTYVEHGFTRFANELATEPSVGRGATGTTGESNFNDNGMIDPETPSPPPNLTQILNEYKSYLRKNLNDINRSFKKDLMIKSYTELNNNKEIILLHGISGLIDEFQSIEQQYHNLSKEDLLSWYQLLLNEIMVGTEIFKNGETKKVLSYLYTIVLNKIYSLKDNTEPTLIIDINGYLNYISEDIKSLENLKEKTSAINFIKNYKETYENNISEKIKDAKNFIQSQIIPELNDINRQIDEKINTLVKETLELLKVAEGQREEAIKKRNELQRILPLKRLIDVTKVASQALSFLGPKGQLAGMVLQSVSSVSESLLIDNAALQPTPLQILPTVVNEIGTIATQIKTIKEKKVANLNDQLNAVSQELTKCPKESADALATVTNYRERLEEVKTKNGTDFDTVTKLENDFHKTLKQKEDELKSKKEIKEKDMIKAVSVIENINRMVQITTAGMDVYNKYKQDQDSLDEISRAIKESDKQITQLKQYEETVYKSISPMLNNMKAEMDNTAMRLDKKSLVSLDITKWRVQSTLKDMKLQMQEFTAGFKVSGNLARCLEKLDEAMTTLINIYDRIENYQERKEMIDYIAHVNSPVLSGIDVTDPKLSNALGRLEIQLRSNLVVNQYKLAMDAFKQWVFPFAHYYLRTFTLPSELKLDGNIENTVSTTMAQVNNLRGKLNEYKLSIARFDQHIQFGEFNSRGISTKPFFVWKNKKYANTISRLLSGESVALKADILKSPFNKDAIKFNSIEINIKSINKTQQSIIEDQLKGFEISIIHNGNSYYRYGDRLYVISSDTQTIRYSFEKNSNGVPTHKNQVYEKIKSGDLLLSPYAMWRVQLMKMDDNFSFDNLSIYQNEVDLELTGTGSYVRKDNGLNLNVEDYYKVDDTIVPGTNELQDEEVNDLQSYQTTYIRPKRSTNVYNHVISKLPEISQRKSLIREGSFDDNNNDTHTNALSHVSNWLDVNGNLTLAQMTVGMVVGKNKTLSNNSFVSFEENRNKHIEELASYIRPIVELDEDSLGHDQDDNDLQSQWYYNLLHRNESAIEEGDE